MVIFSTLVLVGFIALAEIRCCILCVICTFTAGVSCSSNRVNFLPPDREPRPTLLPLIQSPDCAVASKEPDSSDVVARIPSSADDDDSAPPLVRFKNRYRRAVEQQQQVSDTVRDWNHNEMRELKKNSPDVASDDTCCYVSRLSSKILSDPDVLSRDERKSVAEEARPCEKRAWSRITPEVDCPDSWMSSNKMPCHDGRVDSTRTNVYSQLKQPESDASPNRYQQPHQRSLEYQNYVIDSIEPKCEPTFIYYNIVCVNWTLKSLFWLRIQFLT